MMTKKVISSQSRGKTKEYDEALQFKNSDGAWVPAVYHESIRLDLIHQARLKGKYGLFVFTPVRSHPLLIAKPVHERGSSTTPGDITSYLESQRTWGTERGGQYGDNYHKGNWPAILYQLRKPGNFLKSDYPEAEIWKYNGRVVLSVHDSLPLRKYENLPDTISSKISGAELEAMLRSDPRVETRDIKGRMPMYYITETGKRILSFTPSTFSMRTHRFRAKHALLCWRERAGSSTTNDLILNYLQEHEPQAFREGYVEGIGPIPKALEDAILGSNKTNPAVTNRAGKKYALDHKQNQPRPEVTPAPTTRLEDNRSQSPHATRRTITDREQGPLERNPTTMQNSRLPQSVQPPGQPPAASRRPRGRPRIKALPPTAAPQPSEQQPLPASGPHREGPKMKNTQGRALPQPPEQQPPPEGPKLKNTHGRAPSQSPERKPPLKRPRMENTHGRAPSLSPERQPPLELPTLKNTHGRAPSQSPERKPPLKRPRMENTEQRAPPRSPEQSLAPPRPLTRGHENDAPTAVLQPEQEDTFKQLPAASIPPVPPRTKARTKYVPPPRPRTRKALRKNPSTSLTQQNDERRGEREEARPAQNPVRMQTRSQQAARSVSATAEQQLLPAPRPSRRVPGINPPMTVPQPEQEQQQQQQA